MRQLLVTYQYSRLVMHLSIVLVAFVLGHDVMLAMDPGEEIADISHHVIAVEQCGPEDGVAHALGSLLLLSGTDGLIPGEIVAWPDAQHNSDRFAPLTIDTSRLRAFLQVYLN